MTQEQMEYLREIQAEVTRQGQSQLSILLLLPSSALRMINQCISLVTYTDILVRDRREVGELERGVNVQN